MIDGLVIVAGAGVLFVVACVLTVTVLARVAQHVERRSPDRALPPLRSFVHRGCEFDRQKYLEGQLKRAQRRLREARQRQSELFALAHPQFQTPTFDPAPVSTPLAHTVTLSDRFYHGQVRAAFRRAQ